MLEIQGVCIALLYNLGIWVGGGWMQVLVLIASFKL